MFFEAKDVTPDTLLAEVQRLANAKCRFVTMSQTVVDENTLRLFYHFDENLTMSDLRHNAELCMWAPTDAKGRTRLRVAITPTFCRQIVMPRLELFRNAYPEVELILQVSIPLLNVTAEEADLEVRFGVGGYTDREHRLILSEEVTPVCSPSFMHDFGPFDGFDTATEIDRAHLIRSPLEPWSSWFEHIGLARIEPGVGSQFNDMGLVYDAAASGFGVALLRPRLGNAWLQSGRLVRLSQRLAPSPHHHYICWKTGMLDRWECAAFADWLEQTLA